MGIIFGCEGDPPYREYVNNTIKKYNPMKTLDDLYIVDGSECEFDCDNELIDSNTRRPRLAVDVDLTVCQIDNAWWEWLNHIHHTNYDFPNISDKYDGVERGKLCYDLGWYFGDSEPYNRYESVDFFRKEGAYDFADPIEFSVSALNRLSEHFDIVFVTKIKGNHHKSKYQWLHRHFPFIKTGRHGVVATNEKWWVTADYLIDDRHHYLNGWHKETGSASILFETKYEQDEELLFEPSLRSSNWLNIEAYLMNEEFG